MNYILTAMIIGMVGLIAVIAIFDFNIDAIAEIVNEEFLCKTCNIDNPNDLTTLD